MKKTILIIFMTFFSSSVLSEVIDCDVIYWSQDESHSINVEKTTGVIIHFDNDLVGASNMNKTLWTAVKTGNHITLRPKNMASGQTSITAIDVNNNSYTIIAKQTSSPGAPCVFVKDNESIFNVKSGFAGEKELSTTPTARMKKENVALKGEIEQIKASRTGEIDRAIHAHMAKIRAKNYKWESKKIAEVYDDGRFSYIRTHVNDLKVDSIIGYRYNSAGFLGLWRDEAREILDEGFLSPTNTYKVSGIYDGFILKYGDSETRIERLN